MSVTPTSNLSVLSRTEWILCSLSSGDRDCNEYKILKHVLLKNLRIAGGEGQNQTKYPQSDFHLGQRLGVQEEVVISYCASS